MKLIWIYGIWVCLACQRPDHYQPVTPQEDQNLALERPATASTVENETYAAGQAVDGDDQTFWSSSSNNYKQWLQVDLGTTYQVNKVIIRWADGKFATALDILVSEDGQTWITAFTTNTNSDTIKNVIEGLNGIGRYVRIQGRGRGGGDRYRVYEMEVYGQVSEPTTPAQQVAIDSVTSRLIRGYLAAGASDSNVATYLSTMHEDGSYSDVDYESVTINFPAGTHLNRLKAIATAYRNPASTYYGSAAVLGKIRLGLDFYLSKNPSSSNWWYNDIGGPEDFMVPVLLIKGAISQTDLFHYSAYLKDQTARFAGGGKNLTWIAYITMHKASIEDSYRMLDNAFKAIASPLVIVSEHGAEGIKADYSFHQHHAQLYSGGYGLSILPDFTNALQLAAGTSLLQSFSGEKLQLLANLMLQGHQLLGYRNTFDFGAMGRNISRSSGSYTNVSCAVLDQMASVDPGNAGAYQAWKSHLSGQVFPSAYLGNKHFWKSDIMTQHTENSYLSAKIISKRTYGTESLNGENTKGFNLPLGATNILTDGLEYNGIYPVWDWTRIPGTTAENSQQATALDGYQIGSNDFGGGVSNGQQGLTAFSGEYNGIKTKKAYFFLGKGMYCLGADIQASNANNIRTSVNQTLLDGPVTVHSGTNETSTLIGSQQYSNLRWVHHRQVGYLFPAAASVTVQAASQSGSWKDINIDGSAATENKDVFSIWIEHGNAPVSATYAYLVVPDESLASFQTFAVNPGYRILKNDGQAQGLCYEPLQSSAAVFYEAGSVSLDNYLTLSSDRPVLLLLKKQASSYHISVADPLYTQSGVTLRINQHLSGAGVSYAEGYSQISFSFPTGDDTGSSTSATFSIE